jgi:hypothetical protein
MNIEDKVVSLIIDAQIRDYYPGKYSNNVLEDGNSYKAARSHTAIMASSDRYIENIFILSNAGKPITTYDMFDDYANSYKDFSDTQEAVQIDTNENTNLLLNLLARMLLTLRMLLRYLRPNKEEHHKKSIYI